MDEARLITIALQSMGPAPASPGPGAAAPDLPPPPSALASASGGREVDDGEEETIVLKPVIQPSLSSSSSLVEEGGYKWEVLVEAQAGQEEAGQEGQRWQTYDVATARKLEAEFNAGAEDTVVAMPSGASDEYP